MDLQTILDQMDEIAFISDLDTDELLFLNSAGQLRFGVPMPGTKCYEHLCGVGTHCDFCAKDQPSCCQNQRHTWVRKHPDLGNVLLCHSLIVYEGRPCRLGIVIDVDRYVENLTEVQSDLAIEKKLVDCLERLGMDDDFDGAVNSMLEMILEHYDADRAYVVELDWDKNLVRTAYAVCREDVPPISDPAGSIVTWDSVFKDQEEKLRLVEDVDALSDDPARRAEYEWLHRRGVHRFAAVPVFQDGLLNSFLGVDDPRANTDTPVLLQKITYIAANELRKRQLTEELRQKSYLDPMTMCYNRIAYDEALDRLCGTEVPVGVGCLNLNGLRRINDSLGYSYGDKAIYQACSLLKGCFGHKNVYRVSGDEYMVLWPNVSYEDFTAACEQLRNKLRTEKDFASFGSAWGTKEKVSGIISEAETAMRARKNRYYAELNQSERPAYIDKLLREFRESTFVGYLQPLYSIEKRKVYGAEVLVRKVDSAGRMQFPLEFISALEQYGMISMVDLEMFRQACESVCRWKSVWPDLILNVNFSRATLGEPDCMDRVDTILRDTGADPKQMIVEVTEGSQGMQREVMEARLSALKARGFAVALDDMGTEASCLETLFLPQLDIIKIDRSLISRAEHGERECTVVAGLIELGHRLNMTCVAEGIEQGTQMELLKRLHCDRLQGYYIGKPMPPEEFFERFAPVEKQAEPQG